ncbi:hypothetical protein BST61_g1003 [Cercospora zeina]
MHYGPTHPATEQNDEVDTNQCGVNTAFPYKMMCGIEARRQKELLHCHCLSAAMCLYIRIRYSCGYEKSGANNTSKHTSANRFISKENRTMLGSAASARKYGRSTLSRRPLCTRNAGPDHNVWSSRSAEKAVFAELQPRRSWLKRATDVTIVRCVPTSRATLCEIDKLGTSDSVLLPTWHEMAAKGIGRADIRTTFEQQPYNVHVSGSRCGV